MIRLGSADFEQHRHDDDATIGVGVYWVQFRGKALAVHLMFGG